MLKLSPRTITALVLMLFLGVIFAEQFVHFLETQGNKEEDEPVRAAFVSSTKALQWLDRVDYDIHLRYLRRTKPHEDVVVVQVHEQSLVKLGYFPFSRAVYRTLIERLEKAGARVLAFDIAFSERERNAVNEMHAFRQELISAEGFDSPAAQMLEKRIAAIDSDEAFGNALTSTTMPVVLGFVWADSTTKKAPPPTEELLSGLRDYKIQPRNQGVTRFDKAGNELPLVRTFSRMDGRLPVVNMRDLIYALNKKSSVGHFLPSADDDSVIRRVPVVVEYSGMVFGSLALRAAAAYYGEELTYLEEGGELSVRGVTRGPKGEMVSGKLYAPLTPWGDMLARYYGDGDEFPFIEFSDVVQGEINDADMVKTFKNKIVFVGVTAVGLKDIRATPLNSDFPGVFAHSTVAANILQQNFIVKDFRFFWIGYAMVLLFGLLSAFAVYRLHPALSFLTTMILTVAIQVGAHEVFFERGLVVPTILPSFSCFMVFFTGLLYRYFTEEREKKMVRASFSRYVSGAVVEEILKDQSKLRLGGQKKELTVMFVDLVGFTRISEHMDASVVTQLLNEYFTRMTNILLANKGTLDKYMGDGIMCFWGAPLDIPEHPRLACKTALEMVAELSRINREWKEKHGISIEFRIGVHTGDMAVGNMGSDQVFSYTVMGDNVNLGSRLEGVNTVYGTRVVVSAATAAKAGPEWLFRPLDRVQVKGKEDAVDILELVSLKGEKEPEWVHAFRTGLRHYQAGEWDDAESAFGACLTLKPGDGPSAVFVERIRDFRMVQPDDWNGIWKLSSK